MDTKELFSKIKKAWHWIWNSDSILSWVVALVLIFVMIKFVFFPGLSLIMGNELPLAGVESSSMDHDALKYCEKYDSNFNCVSWSEDYEICGIIFDKKTRLDFEDYWYTCGKWYEDVNISQETFKKFTLKSGFSKGDIMVVVGRFEPKVGDIIIFRPNGDSLAPRPIIHRIVKINSDGTYQTKGDHNGDQLTYSNNLYKTDETTITLEQIIGKAIFKIPSLGWVKIGLVDFIKMIFK